MNTWWKWYLNYNHGNNHDFPGNMSILPYYFQDDGPELVTGESLRAELHLTSGHRIWEIRVSGKIYI